MTLKQLLEEGDCNFISNKSYHSVLIGLLHNMVCTTIQQKTKINYVYIIFVLGKYKCKSNLRRKFIVSKVLVIKNEISPVSEFVIKVANVQIASSGEGTNRF